MLPPSRTRPPRVRGRRSAESAVTIGLVVAIAAFLLMGGSVLLAVRRQLSAAMRVSQANGVVAAIQALSADLETATATQRAYLITGDTSYLVPSRAAMARVVGHARALQRITVTDSVQQERIVRLDRLLSDQMHQLRFVAAMRQDSGEAAAKVAFMRPPIRGLLPSIRKVLGEMDATERARLEMRKAAQLAAARTSSVATIFAMFSAIALVLIGAAAVRTYLAKRRHVDRLKSDLVGIVAHELRSPLTAIHGALRLVEHEATLDEKCTRLVKLASENSSRLLRLVNTMLDLEKIEEGNLDLSWERFPLVKLLDATLDGIAPVAAHADVTIVQEGPRDLMLEADCDRLTQVLTNLLSNAIKFSERGSTVTLAVSAEGDAVRFEVKDRGPGIPDAQRSRLFGRFQQLDNQRGGSGLGLAISRAIVQEHGGELDHAHRDGGGSIFWFRIPRARPA